MKMNRSWFFVAGLLILMPFQNCGQLDSPQADSKTQMSVDSSSNLPPDPAPAPFPVAVPAPQPAAAAFVCDHANNYSICHSQDAKLKFYDLEQYVRINNTAIANLSATAKGRLICKINDTYVAVKVGYPVQYRCAIENLPNRTVAGARPAKGYSSRLHYDAPFRCSGGAGGTTIYPNGNGEDVPPPIFTKPNFICAFDKNEISPENIIDATAEAQYYKSYFPQAGYAVTFSVSCSVRNLMVPPPPGAANVAISVLDCTYSKPQLPPDQPG